MLNNLFNYMTDSESVFAENGIRWSKSFFIEVIAANFAIVMAVFISAGLRYERNRINMVAAGAVFYVNCLQAGCAEKGFLSHMLAVCLLSALPFTLGMAGCGVSLEAIVFIGSSTSFAAVIESAILSAGCFNGYDFGCADMVERLPDFFIKIFIAHSTSVMRIARFFAGGFNGLNKLLLMTAFSHGYVVSRAAVCTLINQSALSLTGRCYYTDEFFVVTEFLFFFIKDFGGAALAFIKASAGLLTSRLNIFDKLLIMAELDGFLIKNLG